MRFLALAFVLANCIYYAATPPYRVDDDPFRFGCRLALLSGFVVWAVGTLLP